MRHSDLALQIEICFSLVLAIVRISQTSQKVGQVCVTVLTLDLTLALYNTGCPKLEALRLCTGAYVKVSNQWLTCTTD